MPNSLKPDFVDDEELGEYLNYLDALRESGATNMFGAASWLESDFGISKSEAKLVLAYWMDTFGTRHNTAEEESNG